ncbi:hypothetical protein [Amycolatopsis jejuensis]|uniref:hypothetical protein n=1 Tax=Amycolatopsis jejuensis TaxID=330084 RepID=UPI0005243296|nr:hypothetical protein [Amycolatopsis jejuensis]
MVTAESGSAGLGVTFAETRPWYEQWHLVRQQLADVEETLANRREVDRVKRVIETFFIACTHLGDWISQDPSTKALKTEVEHLPKDDPSWRICRAVANTSKHHTRNGGITARIQSISFAEHGTTATFAWTEHKIVQTEDALVLAKRCMDRWERFLTENNLQPL